MIYTYNSIIAVGTLRCCPYKPLLPESALAATQVVIM